MMAKTEDLYYAAKDGCKLFVYDYRPVKEYHAAIFIIAGITGINHHNEKDIIDILSNKENRVVIIHPRGTGYSEGKRGDIETMDFFINDFVEIISNDKDYHSKKNKMFFMATACQPLYYWQLQIN
jgi:alpha-beta hydrolase superfamily lysophospholipase